MVSEKAMAPHSSTLAWKIPWMEEPWMVGCSPWGRKESDMIERLHFHFSLSCFGEGNGNPHQCSERARWWWGTAPSEIRGEGTKQYSRQTLVFLGGDAREYPGGLLRLDPAFAYAEPPSS